MAVRAKNEIKAIEEITINGMTIHSKTSNAEGDTVNYARIIPQCGLCVVEELTVRYIYENMFTAINKITKNVLPISNNLIGTYCFTTRKEAQKVIDKAKKSGLIKQVSKEIINDGED